MKELMNNNEIMMTSLEVVELVNNLRKEEGNEKVKTHDNLLKSIDKEIESLKNVGIEPFVNFNEWYYQVEEGGRKYRGYKLTKQGIMQILNKESAYVRYKTQQYIKNIDKEIESLKNVGIQQNEIFRYANIKLKKAEEIIGGK